MSEQKARRVNQERTSLATAIAGMKHWDWCPICRGGLDTGLECDQCGADLMPIYTAFKESLSGGNPGEPNACTGAEERGISGATGAGQHPDDNSESTGDSADRRSPDGTDRTPSPDESNRHPHEPLPAPCSECERLRAGLSLIATDEHRLMNITARMTAESILSGKPIGAPVTKADMNWRTRLIRWLDPKRNERDMIDVQASGAIKFKPVWHICPECGRSRVAGVDHRCPPPSRAEIRQIVRDEIELARQEAHR